LDPAEAPTYFAVSKDGKIRILSAPTSITGRLQRKAPRFGSLPLTQERCAKIDEISLNLLASRDSPAFFGAFQRGFQHLRSLEFVEFKVQLPIIFRLSEERGLIDEIRLAASRAIEHADLRENMTFMGPPNLIDATTETQVGASAWSNRLDQASTRAGPRIEESVSSRMGIDDLLEGKVGFSEIDYLCDVATLKSTLETRVGSDHPALQGTRINWKVELGTVQ
jgi:hypothetical protein